MNILVTGSQGYIGTVLLSQLCEKSKFNVFGIDSGYYSSSLIEELKKDNAIGKTRYNQVKKIIENNLKKLAKEGK